MTIVMKVGAS